MTDRSDSACVLVGMDALVVKVAEERDGELYVLVETKPGPVGCPTCGVLAESKGRRTTLVRDLEVAGRPTVLVWRKRRWRCKDPDCPMKTWSEEIPGIAKRASLTDRAKKEIGRRIGEDARSVASVAKEFGVGWWTAWEAFRAEVEPRIEDPERIRGVEAMGVDETAYLTATKDHPRIFATGMVDVRRGILLDVIEGRSDRILSSWLSERPGDWLRGVQVVTIDPLERTTAVEDGQRCSESSATSSGARYDTSDTSDREDAQVDRQAPRLSRKKRTFGALRRLRRAVGRRATGWTTAE